MSALAGLAILLGAPLALWLIGSGWGHRLGKTPGEHIAWSVLVGLAAVLFAAAVVNAFAPLHGWTAWICFAPGVLVLVDRGLRAHAREATQALFSREGLVLVASATAFLVLLLAPLARREVLFYDGTTNHDAFFWITGAERLQTHSYLETPELSAERPLFNATLAISGWRPAWGRMGAEAWVALSASLTGASPLQTYLFASAALLCAWIAAVFLTVRTFIAEKMGLAGLVALGAVQPLFAFYHHNENLPNLIGMITGATAVLALQEAIRVVANPRALLLRAGVAVLAFHGLLCSYPEMVPFVILPIGALVLRCIALEPRRDLSIVTIAIGTLVVGAVVNPATAARAWHGFTVSLASARANESWANIFANVEPTCFMPALLTLSAKTGRELGTFGGALVSLALATATFFTVRRARESVGLALLFSGAAALSGYTAVTGFLYGWQKTVQFSGVFVAALLPAGLVATLVSQPTSRTMRITALTCTFLFFAYAQTIVCLDLWKWSERKTLHEDWRALAPALHAAHADHVVVDAATFPRSFFHSMWSTYFLRDFTMHFAKTGAQSAGYLRDTVAPETPVDAHAPRLVGREWAERHAGQMPRLLTGREFVLLAGVPQREMPDVAR